MNATIFSVDVEATGRTPASASLLSIGACVVGSDLEYFYCELQPINTGYLVEAMRIGCLGLSCLPKRIGFDPRKPSFRPDLALQLMQKNGQDPADAIPEFCRWVKTVAGNTAAIFASDNPVFDGLWVFYYIDRFFTEPNPFGYSGLSLNSVAKGAAGNLRTTMKKLARAKQPGVKHNALDDARHNARLFEILAKRYQIKL